MRKYMIAVVLCCTAFAKQPVIMPEMTKEFPGVTEPRMFGTVAYAVAEFPIQTTVSEACLVKFTSHRTQPGALFVWVVKCEPTADGVSVFVSVHASVKSVTVPLASMSRDDQAYAANIIEQLWSVLAYKLPTVKVTAK